jgi:hypothetical protein
MKNLTHLMVGLLKNNLFLNEIRKSDVNEDRTNMTAYRIQFWAIMKRETSV